MFLAASAGLLALVSLALFAQLSRAIRRSHAAVAALGTGCLFGATWLWFAFPLLSESTAATDLEQVAYTTSVSCRKCHESHYESWYRSYHRTMTREAIPENVKGNFNNVTYRIKGVTSRMTQKRGSFFIETVDPMWADQVARAGKELSEFPQVPTQRFRVDRVVGSHWMQEHFHRDPSGRYGRLPFAYHLVEDRWIHLSGAFLAPDHPYFYAHFSVWNESCVYCHNTKPQKNRHPMVEQGPTPWAYRTRVEELGIACEACHGPGDEHVRTNSNPLRRFALGTSDRSDATIVNPARLSATLSTDVCAHCHGGAVPKPDAWEATHRDPFTPGQAMSRFYEFFWSSPQQASLAAHSATTDKDPYDGRFWGDGTPLTTALEYQGMALSACYQNGKGNLSCLSCHSMHASDPNHQLREGMRTNQACYTCHAEYGHRLEQHTHHAANSAGSSCLNCHMAYQAYSLLDSHRSHRIEVPRVKDSIGTGKPHACNLCHLDKSLAWTQRQMADWYGHSEESLDEDDTQWSSSIVQLFRGDARTRAVVSAAFSAVAAQQASGTAWMKPVLLLAMEDPYPAIRYLSYRGLRSLIGPELAQFDYIADPAERQRQIEAIRGRISPMAPATLERSSQLPPFDLPDSRSSVIEQLIRRRDDTKVTINE